MERFVLYAYFWHLEPASNYDRTIIRVYGVTEEGENVCVIVDDFTPYAYLELPAGKKYPWDANPQMATAVIKRLESICGNFKPLSMSYKKKHKLYGAHFNPDGSRMTFPYIFCKFKNIKHRSMMEFKIRGSIHVNGIGSLTLRMHEQTATPILQMTTSLELKKAGWIQLMGQRVGADACITTCHHEFRVSWFNMKPYEYNKPAKILGMAFDIEAYSRNSARMPNPEEDADVVFQISCILRREGEKEDKWRRYLLTLGEPDSTIPDNIVVYSYNNEGDLLIGFAELVRDENPNYIAGYNIFGFDINYLYKRAIHTHEIANFSQLGFIEGKQCTLEHLDGLASKMNSRRGDLVYIYAEGRIFIDLYPIAMAQTKLNSYTLNSVAQHYLTDKYQKDPLDHIGIFKCYRVGMRKDENGEYTSKAKRAISICGKYCVKDTELVVMLLDRMRTWYGLVEMAILCNIPIFEVFTEGQQLRIYSQLYSECMRRNYVVEKEGYIPEKGERYRGAYVVDPNPGYYDEVACLDFKSLYPSIMIAHNLCYTTMVMETPVADEDCTVLEWHDHTNCVHDPKIIELDRLKKEIGDIVEQQRKLRKQRDALRISDFDSGLSSNKQIAKKAHAKAVEELNAEIHKLDIQAKPLRERKQSVNVTPKERSTKQMCAHRKYKFVKSSKAKGIVPELLQNILDARARTRKEQKSVGKRVEELKSLMGGSEELNDLEQYWGILEARQLAYKICANSVYGGLGVNDSSSRKFVPLMPVAMCVTYLGREHIQLAAREAQETYGANLVYGDSVLEDTPILCRIDGVICYRTIDNLPCVSWTDTYDGKQEGHLDREVEVWSDSGFTTIKHVIRHLTNKEIYRVLTHTGVVDVTEDHSLIRGNGEEVAPKDVVVGDILLGSNLPVGEEMEWISPDLAFVMGLFYADGSCGNYKCPSGNKSSWAINNTNRELLIKCRDIMQNETTNDFKILETMESSAVLKLVCIGKVKELTLEWRSLMYDKQKYKKVPDQILNSPQTVRQSFLDGYYAGDGDKDENGYFRFDNKGKIGSAGLYYLVSSLGYKASINTRQDKPDIYRITCTKKSQRRHPDKIKRITSLGSTDRWVYDLETENHHFSAGIGRLIVHNTDSIMVNFPMCKTPHEVWDRSDFVAAELTKLYAEPLELEFENIYKQFLIFSKKRYCYRKADRDGVIDLKLGSKGILLARRDNSNFVRTIYKDVLNKFMCHENRDDILYYITCQLKKLLSRGFSYDEFVITMSVKGMGDIDETDVANTSMIGGYKMRTLLSSDSEDRKAAMDKKGVSTAEEFYIKQLPRQAQLAERMRQRGCPPEPGSRLQFVVTDALGKTTQGERIEEFKYFQDHASVLKIDYLYYLEALVTPVDEALNAMYGSDSGFTQNMIAQYLARTKNYKKLMKELESFWKPKIVREKAKKVNRTR